MDPLTHTLVGASLASSKLGEKTRYATAALVIGANLPDIDVLSYFAGGDAALGFRRGWTHGVLALGWKAKANKELITGVKAQLAQRAHRIHWIAGHVGIEDNERADALANLGVDESRRLR